MTEHAIIMRAVNKYYGAFHALTDIDLTVEPGERIVICGPSGSGKSTLIRTINQLEAIESGTITVDGVELTAGGDNVAKVRRDVGMVFQSFNLFPHMTVLENCMLAPMKTRKVSRDEAKATALHYLERVKIPEQADKYPAQLSGGQQQRIALARALVFDPQLVLMDEPLGALDKQLREHMQFEIKHLHEQLGITVVYVTHDQGEALTMSDRVAVFNDGRIQQLAPPAELYERPQNSFVAGFIGENNALAGTIEQLDGEKALVRLDDGGLIDATAVNIREKGQRTTVSIRPERVEFKPEMMPPGAHTIEAQVIEVIYMGDILRARLRVAGSESFVMKMRNTIGQTHLHAGQSVRIGWHPEDARALDPV